MFAHRGGAADAQGGLRPNTLAAFRYAFDQGISDIESDARLTSDGVVVVTEETVRRDGLRRRRVETTPASELSKMGVATLAELYELGKGPRSLGELSLSVDDMATASTAIAAARHADAVDRLWLRSDDLELLRSLSEDGCGARLIHVPRQRIPESGYERHAAELAKAGVAAVRLRHNLWSIGLVILFHRFGVAVIASDARERRHMRVAAQLSVDAVSSNYARRLADEAAAMKSLKKAEMSDGPDADECSSDYGRTLYRAEGS